MRQTHALAHPEAVWDLAPDPAGGGLLLSAHQGEAGWAASLWELDLEGSGRLALRGALGGRRARPLLKLAWSPDATSALAIAEEGLQVWDLADGEARAAGAAAASAGGSGSGGGFTAGAWDPCDPNLACAAEGSTLGVWDLRKPGAPAQALGASAGPGGSHFMQVRDVDYSRAAPGLLASCGDDCRLCLWDLRRPGAPVVCREAHSHWLWCARFNPLHAGLLLTASSDTDVRLWSFPGLKRPAAEVQVTGGAVGSTTFDEHEESVYAVAWSESDPWAFASLSHDGRLVCSRVPDSTKYETMHV